MNRILGLLTFQQIDVPNTLRNANHPVFHLVESNGTCLQCGSVVIVLVSIKSNTTKTSEYQHKIMWLTLACFLIYRDNKRHFSEGDQGEE